MKKTTKDTITVVSFFVSMIAFLFVIIISIYARREAINNIFVHIMSQPLIAHLFLVALAVDCLSFAVSFLFDKLSERITEKDYDYIMKCLKEEGSGEFMTYGKISDDCISYFKEKDIEVIRSFEDGLMFLKEGVGENKE